MINKKQELFSEFFTTMIKMRKLLEQTIAIPTDKRIATVLQTQALKIMSENPNLTAGELANKLKMSSSAITQLTDRLIESQLISRKHSQDDRRVIHFNLTSTGKKQLQKTLVMIKEKTSQILKPMSKKDLTEVIRIFNKILEAYNE